MDFLRKYKLHFLVFILVFFLAGMFFQFGASFFIKGGPNNSIAEVNGEEIPLRVFYSHYQRAMAQATQPGKPVDPNLAAQKQQESIRDLVQSIVFAKQAEKYHIEVPDRQVVTSLASIPAFQDKGHFSPQLYMQALQSQVHLSPKDFEEEQRKSIAFFKLRWLIQSCIRLTDKEFALEAPFVRASLPAEAKNKKLSDTELRQEMWQQKVLYAFNQWFNQIGSTLKVKTHLEVLEGTR